MLVAFVAFLWLVAIAISRRHRRTTCVAAALFAYLLCAGWLGEPALHALETRVPAASPPRYAGNVAIVLLGSGTEYDGAHRLVPKFDAWRRIDAAAAQFTLCRAQRAQCTLVISGGNPQKHEHSEAVNYRPHLVSHGVPASNIVLEPDSLNTYENARNTGAILRRHHYDQIVLITSAYHLPRALLDFHHFGINAVPFASNHRWRRPGWRPHLAHVINTRIAWHEWIGLAQFYVYRRIGWF
ncbi:YdcF family protein [Mycetohabitans sp. B46]|uniref:YdcF family protein n=1 Tax=Mycetohabitans sp. B46 TaxID=2772536 RepID=UPI00307F1510